MLFKSFNKSIFQTTGSILFICINLVICFGISCKPQKTKVYARPSEGKVVGISDGDTFTLLVEDKTREKIRLHGIDCPEKRQDFGQVAKKKLSDLIFGQYVRIKRIDLDRYGRTIAMVYRSDGINVNEEMLKEGLAWHYLKYDKNSNWDQMEKHAREQKKGLWSLANAVPPWEWRNRKK